MIKAMPFHEVNGYIDTIYIYTVIIDPTSIHNQ